MNRRYFLLFSLLTGVLISQNLLAVSACKKNGAIIYTKACLDEMQAKKLNDPPETEPQSKQKSEPLTQADRAPAALTLPIPSSSQIIDKVDKTTAPKLSETSIAEAEPRTQDEGPGHNDSVAPKRTESTTTQPAQTETPTFADNNQTAIAPLADLRATQPTPCDLITLVKLVESADRAVFLACAATRINLNQQDERKTFSGRSLLHWAVASQQPEMVKLLLDRGADLGLQSRSDRGAQPIHLAAESGQGDILRQLLEQGAALESRDYFKRTPLHRAIEAGQFEISQQLIAAGANPNARDRIGTTPLMLSTKQTDIKFIRLLMDSGADPDQVNTRGMTALHLAVTHSRNVVEELLQQGVEIDSRNREGQTPLLLVASLSPQRYWSMIKLLIEKGANPSSAANNQQTLLDYSLAHNHLPLFELLLSRGWDSDGISLGQLKGKTRFMQILRQQGRI